MGQDPAFQVIDRLTMLSDRSITNKVSSDKEIASAKKIEEQRSKGLIPAKSKAKEYRFR